MPPRSTPPRPFPLSADGPRALADRIGEQLRRETYEQTADAGGAVGHPVSGVPASAAPQGSRPRVEDFLDMIMRREGGFVDDPRDAGGKTNYGITQRTLTGWNNQYGVSPRKGQSTAEPRRLPGVPGVIPQRVEDLTPEQARALHKDLAWDQYGLDRIKDDNVAFHMFDMLANTSPGGVEQIVYPAVQEVLRKHFPDHYGATVSLPKEPGFGQAIDRINQIDQLGSTRELQEALVNHRLAYVKARPNHQHFRKGWTQRIEQFRPRSTPPEGWYGQPTP